jgi:CBS domain-containing protein
MFIREVLSLKGGELFSIAPDDPVSLAVARMSELDIGSLVVKTDVQMLGLITERDVIRAMVKHGCSLKDAKVSEIMVSEPIVATPDDTVDYARDVMTKTRVSHLPVLEGNKLVGVISFHDVAKACLKDANYENSLLKRYIKLWPEG